MRIEGDSSSKSTGHVKGPEASQDEKQVFRGPGEEAFAALLELWRDMGKPFAMIAVIMVGLGQGKGDEIDRVADQIEEVKKHTQEWDKIVATLSKFASGTGVTDKEMVEFANNIIDLRDSIEASDAYSAEDKERIISALNRYEPDSNLVQDVANNGDKESVDALRKFWVGKMGTDAPSERREAEMNAISTISGYMKDVSSVLTTELQSATNKLTQMDKAAQSTFAAMKQGISMIINNMRT